MYVIDASVYVSALQPAEADHAASRRLLADLQARQTPVACPTLVWAEVAAALARGTHDPALARAAVSLLRRLPYHRYVPLDSALASMAAAAAARCQLRGADAVYVALAQRLNWTLVTLDAEQSHRALPLVRVVRPGER